MNAEDKVLIIDSNQEHCKQIKDALLEYGIGAYYTLSVVNAIERLMRHPCQLVILDISLSETEGLQLLRFMRQMRDMPILVLSSQSDYDSKERAYSLGADDYIEKPLELRDCLLRAQALIRRYNASTPIQPGQRRYTIVNFENMRIDPRGRYVIYNGREIEFPRREFDLLYLLASHAGQVLTHQQIRRHVWGDDFVGDESNAIPISVSRLRQKLEDNPIETVRGVGYRFKKENTEKE